MQKKHLHALHKVNSMGKTLIKILITLAQLVKNQP